MFKEYLADLRQIKQAIAEGRIGDALRLNAAFQLKVADLYDMLVGNRHLVGVTPEDQKDCDECKKLLGEVDSELSKAGVNVESSDADGRLALSPIEWIAVIKQGIDFAKILIDAWRNRNNP